MLLGPNGAGKTTLIRALVGVLKPTEGRVLWGQVDIWAEASQRRDFHATLGWVPQNPGLPPGMTVSDLLRYTAWLKRVPEDVVPGAIDRALEVSDLDRLARRRVRTLSGGETRRLVLASAVVNRPEILVLDEPTAGLDPEQRDHFLSMVRTIGADTTVIMATHLYEDVLAVADVAMAIEDGRVIGQEALADLTGTSDRAAMTLTGLKAGLGRLRDAARGNP